MFCELIGMFKYQFYFIVFKIFCFIQATSPLDINFAKLFESVIHLLSVKSVLISPVSFLLVHLCCSCLIANYLNYCCFPCCYHFVTCLFSPSVSLWNSTYSLFCWFVLSYFRFLCFYTEIIHTQFFYKNFKLFRKLPVSLLSSVMFVALGMFLKFSFELPWS